MSVKTLKTRLFRFFFEDFRLCPHYNDVNYGARRVCKPLFGAPVQESLSALITICLIML